MVRLFCLMLLSFSAHAMETDAIFYSLPSQAQGHFLTVKKLFAHEKGGVWVQDIRNQIYYFDGQHFSPLPGRVHSQGSDDVAYLFDHFWFVDSGRLLKVDTSGQVEVVLQAENGRSLQALGASEQMLWMYGEHNFYTFDPQTGEQQTYPVTTITHGSDLDTQGILSAVKVAGKWIAATHDSIFYMEKGGPRRVLSQQFIKIKVMKFDRRSNRLLVGTQSGLFSINMAGITPDVKTIASGQIQSLLISDDEYWIGTKKGLSVYKKSSQQLNQVSASYQNELALTNNNVRDLVQDNKQGVWIATDKGINYYSQTSRLFQRVRFGSAKDQIPYVHINDIEAMNGQAAWLATNSGLFKVSVDKNKPESKRLEKLLDLDISHVSQVGDSLWISYGSKLIRYDINNGKLYVVREQDKWAGSDITHLVADQQGNLWLSTQLGLYHYFPATERTDEFGLEWLVDQYGPAAITSLSVGRAGQLWIGTDHGVYLHQGQEIIFESQSASDGEVVSLSQSGGNQLWTSSSYGLRNIELTDTTSNKAAVYRSGSVPLCVIGTDDGAWVTTTKGIDFYDTKANLTKQFTSPFGLVANEFLPNGCSLSPDGKNLVFTSKLGLMFASTDTLKQSQLPENDVLVGQLQLDHSLQTVAPLTDTPIHVDYGLSFSVLFGVLPNFETPQLQYRIIGSDKDNWVDFQGSQLTFENLEPGQYTLEFKTPSQVGTGHKGVQYIFIVDKPWYLLPQTIFLLCLLVVSAIVGLVYWRSKAILKANMRLRRIINLKTQQLKHQSQLLVSSNMQLRQQAQTRKTLVSDRIQQAKERIEDLKAKVYEANALELKQVSLEQSERVLEPINQVLAIYSKDKCSTLLDGQVVSLVLKAVVKGWQQETDKSGITLLAEDNTQGCMIKVKKFNLDLILNTLMASALIRSHANQIIHLAARLDDEMLRISIEDNGSGVSEQEVDAYEKYQFAAVDAEFADSYSDTSLCAIAHMAEQSGGRFDFHYNQLTHITQLSITWPIESFVTTRTAATLPKADNAPQPQSKPPKLEGYATGQVKAKRSTSSTESQKQECRLWLDKVYQLVDEQFSDPDFSTGSAAKMLYLSERSLQRKFKTQSGGSFMDYVTKVRLEKACELLIAGEKISDTAYATGFNDPSYFSQRFKNHFGLSPSQFIENSIG